MKEEGKGEHWRTTSGARDYGNDEGECNEAPGPLPGTERVPEHAAITRYD